MGSTKEKGTDTKMETNNGSVVYFSPSNPRLPVKLFLSIMEYEAKNLNSPNDIIPLALSTIDTSDILGTPAWQQLEAEESWEGFKSLMEKMFDKKKASIWDKVELLKSLVKGESENARHFLLRVSHVARIIKDSEEEMVRLMFLAGLQDWETELCLTSNASDLETLANLLNSHNDNTRIDHPKNEPLLNMSMDESHNNCDNVSDIKGECEINPPSSGTQLENLDPLSTDCKKPVMTYSELICETFKHSSKEELTVKQILRSISKRHPFYTMKDKKWQNSVRCNLTINKELYENLEAQKWRELKREEELKANKDLLVPPGIIEDKTERSIKTQQNVFHCNRERCFYNTEDVRRLNRHQSEPHYPKDSEGNYSCNSMECSFSTKVKKSLLQHIRRVHCKKEWIEDQKAILRCEEPECYFRTRARCNLERHQADPHIARDKKGKFNCLEPGCSFQSPTKGSIVLHMKRVHQPCVCDVCGENFQGETRLKTHVVRVHNGKAAHACKFEGCNYKTNHSINLKRHINTKHEKTQELFCEKCTYRTINPANMHRHMKSHAPPSERTFFGCIMCSQTTAQKSNLRAHMMKKHNTPLKDFRTVRGREDHLRYHHLTGTKYDEGKLAKLLEPISVRKHDKNTENLHLSCPICQLKCRYTGYLERHMVAVHGVENKKIQPIQCKQCEYTTIWPQCLDKHVRVVHSAVPLKNRKTHLCSHCGSKFLTSTQLKTHINAVHLKIKRYRCRLCDIVFSSGGNLKEHIGIKHMNMKDAKEWRRPENKSIREGVSKHEAWEFLPADQDKPNLKTECV